MTEHSSCINNKAMMDLSEIQNPPVLDCNSPQTSSFVTNVYLPLSMDLSKIKTPCKSHPPAGASCYYKVAAIFPVQLSANIANSFFGKAATSLAPVIKIADTAQFSLSKSASPICDSKVVGLPVYLVAGLVKRAMLFIVDNLAGKDVVSYRPKLDDALTVISNQKIKTIVAVAFTLFLQGKSFSQTTGDWPNSLGSASGNKTYTLGNTLGVGTASPKAWAEVLYCPQSLPNPFPGLIVTSTDACMGGGTGIGGPGIGITDGLAGANEVVSSSLLGITQYVPIQFPPGTGYHSINGSSQDPLFIARTQSPFTTFGTTNIIGQEIPRFIVWPNGNTGINTVTPRAALDVVGTLPNKPVAIFGVRSQFKATKPLGNLQLDEFYSKHIDIYSQITAGFGNLLTQAHDQMIGFTDGRNSNGFNLDGGLVIAPLNSAATSGGIRIDKNGTVEIPKVKLSGVIDGDMEVRGQITCNGVVSKPKWWPDYVFGSDYRLISLDSVAKYIALNKHLPGMPSETEIVTNGQDMMQMQQLQQEKIEELMLYILQLKGEVTELKKQISISK